MALTKLTTNLISGDIVTSVNGSSGAVTLETGTDWQTAIQTSNFTAVASKGYFVNTTSAEITVTLPVGVVGTEIVIQDYAGTFATNKIILAANGSEKIQGSTSDFECITNNATVTLIYQDATEGWTSDVIVVFSIPLTVDYLVVAGGGGAGYDDYGGGGAGGLRTSYGSTSGGGSSAESSQSLIVNTNYSVTIGSGGSGDQGNNPSSGTNSNFNSIISIGGGKGNNAATSGGSGSGGSGNNANGLPVGIGTTGQGYNGGPGYPRANNDESGGGGGGAGSIGGSGVANIAGNGGSGLAVSITGSSVYYAGGGGGGGRTTGGAGGSGGGAAGTGAASAINAIVNTGGGGGAAGANSGNYSGSNGGSGVVILRYPSVYTISPTSGSGGFTYTTDTSISNTKVTTFTAAGGGNIQFTI